MAGAKKKLSMAAFRELRQSRGLLDEAVRLRGLGDLPGARQQLELAVKSSADAVEARVALAQAVWDDAGSQEELRQVEALLVEARTIAMDSASVAEAAHEGAAAAKLARLLIQEGRDAQAEPLLRQYGFSHRLSSAVLCGGFVLKADASWERVDATREAESDGAHASARDALLAIFNDALPPSMLEHLQQLFAVDSAFWHEHGYHKPDTGYFSYTHSLAGEPASTLDQIMRYLWGLAKTRFPAAARATRVEWWAHSRPHPSGHQLHFDSDDEGRGGLRHPIVTSVCYLSEVTRVAAACYATPRVSADEGVVTIYI